MSSRARILHVNEVVHVSNHGSAIGTVTETTKKQDHTMSVVDENHTIKATNNEQEDHHKFPSTTTAPTKYYVR